MIGSKKVENYDYTPKKWVKGTYAILHVTIWAKVGYLHTLTMV